MAPDTLFYVEHDPVLTLGRNADPRHILASQEILSRAGIEVHEANRGGDVTYHGPGQLVAYAIFDLAQWRKDVRAFVHALEEAVVRTLSDFGLAAHTRAGKETGVYVKLADGRPAKICALGIHISRWVSSHGLALNIDPDLSHFQYIVPCGLTFPVTSLRAQGVAASRAEVQAVLTRHLADLFVFHPQHSQLEAQEILP